MVELPRRLRLLEEDYGVGDLLIHHVGVYVARPVAYYRVTVQPGRQLGLAERVMRHVVLLVFNPDDIEESLSLHLVAVDPVGPVALRGEDIVVMLVGVVRKLHVNHIFPVQSGRARTLHIHLLHTTPVLDL